MKKEEQYTQGSLYTQDELKPFESSCETDNKPVTVLGKTFDNDNERRTYFREELRKKLPELRNIEGFPIGSDDDIINLSDPPYYTACPNPWLNDFIAQWEEEKKELVKQGKRDEDKIVTEPYASDVSEGKNNPIYNAHFYHTKVPHPAIMRYLLHYTEPGDIVYDGFCGTGMTGVACTLCNDSQYDKGGRIAKEFRSLNTPIKWGKRHAILSDLSPVASLISGVYNSPIDLSVLSTLQNIVKEAKHKFEYLYKTQTPDGKIALINYVVWSDVFICPHCGGEILFSKEAVDDISNKVKDSFECPHCQSMLTKKNLEKCWMSIYDGILGETIRCQKKVPVLINYSIGSKTGNKVPDEYDMELFDKAEQLSNSFAWTKDRMIEGSEARRNDRQGITHVHHFYFPKSRVILEYLLSQINDKELKFLVNSQLINISKLNRYRPGISFPYNPLSGTLYIGSQISESNVFIALENKLKKMTTAFSLLKADNVTGVSSATHCMLKDNSIDYIFTDPPFGANFSYSELNFIQESWLKVKTDNHSEAIINNSLAKTKEIYQSLMTKSLQEYYRVLKPGKWITIEFSNTNASVWNAIQTALQTAGFILTSVAALDKQAGSFKAITTPTAVKQDLVLTCFKQSDELKEKFSNEQNTIQNIWDFVDEYLQHLPVCLKKDNATTTIIERDPNVLYNRLISYYVQRGYPVPLDAPEFLHEVRELFLEIDGMIFTATQAAEYEEKKKLSPEFELCVIISDEASAIQWLKNQLRDNPKTSQDLLTDFRHAKQGVRQNDMIPDLKVLLEENFIEVDGCKWRLPNIQDDIDKEALRTKSLLKEFKQYVEMAKKPKARIGEARVEALRAGFKDCYIRHDFQTIVTVGDKIPQNLRDEDDLLLQIYINAQDRCQ